MHRSPSLQPPLPPPAAAAHGHGVENSAPELFHRGRLHHRPPRALLQRGRPAFPLAGLTHLLPLAYMLLCNCAPGVQAPTCGPQPPPSPCPCAPGRPRAAPARAPGPVRWGSWPSSAPPETARHCCTEPCRWGGHLLGWGSPPALPGRARLVHAPAHQASNTPQALPCKGNAPDFFGREVAALKEVDNVLPREGAPHVVHRHRPEPLLPPAAAAAALVAAVVPLSTLPLPALALLLLLLRMLPTPAAAGQ